MSEAELVTFWIKVCLNSKITFSSGAYFSFLAEIRVFSFWFDKVSDNWPLIDDLLLTINGEWLVGKQE